MWVDRAQSTDNCARRCRSAGRRATPVTLQCRAVWRVSCASFYGPRAALGSGRGCRTADHVTSAAQRRNGRLKHPRWAWMTDAWRTSCPLKISSTVLDASAADSEIRFAWTFGPSVASMRKVTVFCARVSHAVTPMRRRGPIRSRTWMDGWAEGCSPIASDDAGLGSSTN